MYITLQTNVQHAGLTQSEMCCSEQQVRCVLRELEEKELARFAYVRPHWGGRR